MRYARAYRWGSGVLLVAGLTACGSGLRPKIVEIESILTSDTQTRLFRFEVEYDGNKVDEVYVSADGETATRSVPTYDGDRITKVEVLDSDGELTRTTQVTYEGSEITRILRGAPEGGDSLLRAFDYEDGRVQTITYSDTRTNPITGESESTGWTENFRYDKKKRVEQITLEGLGNPQIQTLSWDDDDTLQSVALEAAEISDTFAYDEGARLERVNTWDLRRHTLTYGENGYIFEIESVFEDETTTTRYYYDDGSVDGLQPQPDVPGGEFFDIEGHIVAELIFNSLDLLR